MNKLIVALMMTFSFTAQSSVFVSYCSNFGTGIGASYQSCVNNNARKIAAKLEPAYVRSCFYYGGSMSSYTSCVNSVMSSLVYKTEGNVYASYCMSFGDVLSGSFTSCVQNNFQRLGNYVNGLDSSTDID